MEAWELCLELIRLCLSKNWNFDDVKKKLSITFNKTASNGLLDPAFEIYLNMKHSWIQEEIQNLWK